MEGVPKLILLTEQFRGKKFELTKDLHMVGRTNEHDICIEDPTVSSHHCDFIRHGSTYILKDKGSTNGTRINNVPVTEHELEHSDILQIGGVEIFYACHDRTFTTEMRHQTGISLDFDGAGTAIMRRDFDDRKREFRASMSHKLIFFLILVLVLTVMVLLGVLAATMFERSAQLRPELAHRKLSAFNEAAFLKEVEGN